MEANYQEREGEDKVMEHAARILNWMYDELGLDEAGRSDVIMCLMAHDASIYCRDKGLEFNEMLTSYVNAFCTKLEVHRHRD